MQHHKRIALWLIAMGFVVGLQQGVYAQSPDKLVFAYHVTIPPSWFDPAETPAQITPFGILYALHDAVVRPLPGERMAPALAASWTESPDGRVYEFKLRQGLRFHNGDPCTADFWLEFPEQWDPKSVWADKRVRLAVNYVLDRQAINEAACLGFCSPAGVIVPRMMEYALPAEPIPSNLQKAR